MSDYWHRAYICPFWLAAGKKSIRCEGECVITFSEKGETREYIDRYCASFDYGKCTIAMAKNRHYDQKG